MPLVPILTQMNPVHVLLSLRSILILSYHVHLELQSGLLLSLFIIVVVVIIIIIIIITVPQHLGLDRPVSAMPNSFFLIAFVCLVYNSFFATKTPCVLHPLPISPQFDHPNKVC
jgi:hypothetical protein